MHLTIKASWTHQEKECSFDVYQRITHEHVCVELVSKPSCTLQGFVSDSSGSSRDLSLAKLKVE